MNFRRRGKRGDASRARRGAGAGSGSTALRVSGALSEANAQLLRDRLDQWRALHSSEPGTAWMGLAGCAAARRSGDGLHLIRVSNERLWVESALHPTTVVSVPLWAVVNVELLRLSERGDSQVGDLLHVLEPVAHGDQVLAPSVLDTGDPGSVAQANNDHFLLVDVDAPRELSELIVAKAIEARQGRIAELHAASGAVRIPTQRPRRLASVSALRVVDGPEDPDGDGPDPLSAPVPDEELPAELLSKLSGNLDVHVG